MDEYVVKLPNGTPVINYKFLIEKLKPQKNIKFFKLEDKKELKEIFNKLPNKTYVYSEFGGIFKEEFMEINPNISYKITTLFRDPMILSGCGRDVNVFIIRYYLFSQRTDILLTFALKVLPCVLSINSTMNYFLLVPHCGQFNDLKQFEKQLKMVEAYFDSNSKETIRMADYKTKFENLIN
jgi:hypothetical protein